MKSKTYRRLTIVTLATLIICLSGIIGFAAKVIGGKGLNSDDMAIARVALSTGAVTAIVWSVGTAIREHHMNKYRR